MPLNISKKLIKDFYPFAKQQLGFDRPAKVVFVDDDQNNANDPLGKTGHYEPETFTITLFILNRHPKDILRSFCHELVHHAQNCRGDLDKSKSSEDSNDEFYAQNDEHLRNMEKEAYELSGILVRDWQDGLKKQNSSNTEFLRNIMENEEHPEAKKYKKIKESEKKIQDVLNDRLDKLNKRLIDRFVGNKRKEDKK